MIETKETMLETKETIEQWCNIISVLLVGRLRRKKLILPRPTEIVLLHRAVGPKLLMKLSQNGAAKTRITKKTHDDDEGENHLLPVDGMGRHQRTKPTAVAETQRRKMCRLWWTYKSTHHPSQPPHPELPPRCEICKHEFEMQLWPLSLSTRTSMANLHLKYGPK